MNRNANLLSAVCSAALAVSEGAPKWVQLFQPGVNAPADGRAPWKLTYPKAVILASQLPMPIDYDHGADRDPTQTMNSRAAGWIEELADHGPNNEPGLWARVDWTPDGEKAVASKDYRFLSPSFLHTKTGNEITQVLRAALTNAPALHLKALASVQQMETSNLTLEEFLAQLRKALGLPDTATADDCIKSISSLKNGTPAVCSQMASIMEASGLSKDTKVDDTVVAAICAKLKTPALAATGSDQQKQIDELQKQVASLTAAQAAGTAADAVEKAIASGKITPAQKDWAVGYAARDPKGFDEFIGKAPVVLKDGKTVETTVPEGELTETEKKVCALTGLSEEAFKAEKKALAAKGGQ